MAMIEKFGGTSMARPDIVLGVQDGSSNAIVVSAPGKSLGHPHKLTDLLRAYDGNPNDELVGLPMHALEDLSVERIASLAVGYIGTDAYAPYADGIRDDMRTFKEKSWPVDALGEKWSARLFSEMSGLELLDPVALIKFRKSGKLNHAATQRAIQKAVHPDRRYVLPGYYGGLPDGSVHTLPRGGSDITGGVVARAVSASEYLNWSDVSGFLSVDPKKAVSTPPVFLAELTYGEAREFGKRGSELLHRTVPEVLGETSMTTVMCNTWTGERGTRITQSRDWRKTPIVGVTTDTTIVSLSLREYGMNEESGRTLGLVNTLRKQKVPFHDAATGEDDVLVTVDEAGYAALRNSHKNPELVARLNVEEIATLHIVGEGLLDPRERMGAYRVFANALDDAQIGSLGMTDAGKSPGMTYFIARDEIATALSAVHEVIANRLLSA